MFAFGTQSDVMNKVLGSVIASFVFLTVILEVLG